MTDPIEVEVTVTGVQVGDVRRYSLDAVGVPLAEVLESIPGLDAQAGGFDVLVRNEDQEVLITPRERQHLSLGDALRRSTSGDLQGKRFRVDATGEHVGARGAR